MGEVTPLKQAQINADRELAKEIVDHVNSEHGKSMKRAVEIEKERERLANYPTEALSRDTSELREKRAELEKKRTDLTITETVLLREVDEKFDNEIAESRETVRIHSALIEQKEREKIEHKERIKQNARVQMEANDQRLEGVEAHLAALASQAGE